MKTAMKDLTKGSPFKLILLFALPVFAGSVLQQLYNMIDYIIVGNTVNADAFTGVGLTSPISFLILGFANGLTSGFSVRVAQRFGAGDGEGVRRAVSMSFLLCIILSVVITAVSVPLTGPLLRLMQTPDKYFDYAYWYLFVIFCGIAATVFYNIMAGVLRAVGDSVAPLVVLVAAVAVNIGLDFALIVGLKLHYIGAALATVISQFIAGVCCLVYMLLRYPALRLGKKDFKWSGSIARGHIAIGLPMALQYSITAVGCMIQQTAFNGLDAAYPGMVTAFAAASKIDNLANQTFVSLGVAMATYAGQNCGACRMDRVKKGVLAGMVYVVICSLLGVAFCLGLCDPLMRLFLNTETTADLASHFNEIMDYGRKYLAFQSGCYPLLGTIYVYRNALQGIGKSAVTTIAGVTEVAGRMLAAFVLVRCWGFFGACASNPVAWLAADIFLLITYYVVMYGKKKGGGKRRNEEKEPSA